MNKPKKKSKGAIWKQAFPAQAKKLHPERDVFRAGIKSRSTSHEIRMAVYRAIRLLYLDRHSECEACPIISKVDQIVCGGGPEVHHSFGKSGWLLLDIRKWVPVCRTAHTWIDSNRDKARKLGLLAPAGKFNNDD